MTRPTHDALGVQAASMYLRESGLPIPIVWPRKEALFGVWITVADYPMVLDTLFEAADQGKPAIVEHLAVNNLITAFRDADYLRMLNQFDVVAVDGQGIRLALRLLNKIRLQDRVTARELMLAICERASHTKYGIYLYGDETATLEQLRLRLSERFPHLRILGSEASVFRPLTTVENDALVKRINRTGASFVFIGLGCPRQERFVFANRKRINAIQLCVGSSFKFLAGERKIAPRWMQAWGMEWIHRLQQDPKRLFARYLVTNLVFGYLCARGLARAWKSDKKQNA
jgi:N-acetylglucosaminyldiphosphoundecaprenol N-acetyl-beta-D-mannosaminyltransferase